MMDIKVVYHRLPSSDTCGAYPGIIRVISEFNYHIKESSPSERTETSY